MPSVTLSIKSKPTPSPKPPPGNPSTSILTNLQLIAKYF